MFATHPSTAVDHALARIDRHSPFLRNLASRRPEIVGQVADGRLRQALVGAREGGMSGSETAHALRRERQAVALGVALADLAGLIDLEEVVAILSDFADRALHRAIAVAIEERTPGEPVIGFAALALGKHGSRELNYSSDIDPILLFDPATLPRRPREDVAEAAVRIARRVVELLQNRDGEGYVFRVDLRLRPSPEATPLALSVGAALSYYESSALPWERAAFIRARAAAGDIALGTRFLEQIRPFVWRRSLDFGAIREIRNMSHRIRDHHAQGQLLGPGFDLKRGRGGIREVEFYAQIHQLIHGGREPSLRAPATLDALAALAEAGQIAPEDAATLADAYRVLRTVEHRLQMVDDQQTHRLPPRADALDNVAQLHGLVDGAALVELLAPHTAAAGRIYDGLDGGGPRGLSRDPHLIEAELAEAGFGDPVAARARIENWREGRLRTLRTAAAQEALEAVMPTLVATLGRAPDGNAALNRFDGLVSRLPSAVNLFRLLEARPALTRTLMNVLSHAPTLAQELGRRAELLDGLIDATAFDPPPLLPELARELARREAGDDYQTLLDRVRQRVGERRFALGVQLIEGARDPIEVASGYARVAEAAIDALASATIDDFTATHGTVPGGELAILALGRLGGGALTHASDLDLIYLFSGDYRSESNGRKPLGATQYFNRLAQRVSAALSVPTAAGPLYEVDTRLRPSGAQGLLASSIDSFARYEAESAWTWEHMALTRARPVYGSADARGQVETILRDTLHRERDPVKLIEEVVHMRGEIARHKPPAGPFDVKLIEGGLIDAEFTVHLLQLLHRTGFDPRLRRAAGALADAGLLSADFAGAHEFLTRMLVTLRLVSPASSEPPEPSRDVVARACGQAQWTALLARLDEARTLIRGEWRRVAGLG
jgi:glutamate-ammonia-ligase adenylyltransferase